jgi:cytochrome d ubiquinol oxidase subunit II
MLLMHGAAWLSLKAEGWCQDRARRIRLHAGHLSMVGYALAGLWLAVGIDGFAIVGEVRSPTGRPIRSTSRWRGDGKLALRLCDRPWIAIAPIMGFLGMALALRGLRAGREVSTLLWSKLGDPRRDLVGRADDVPVHPAVVV